MTRARNTADTQTASGGPVSPSIAGKNAIINGGMDIWQRGTSITMSSTAYTADRWNGYRSVAGGTVSRQTTSDTTNLPFVQYCTRVQRDTSNTSIVKLYYGTTIETTNSIPYAGKTVTLSFYARAGANFSAASSALNLSFGTGTNTDVNYVTGSASGWTTTTQTYTLTTTWQRFTYTTTIPSTAVQIASMLDYTPVGTAGAADYFEITGVQLEVGSTATPFSRAGGSIQGELAACQRYYQRVTSGAAYGNISYTGAGNSATFAYVFFPLKTSLRVTPSAIDFSAVGLDDGVNSVIAVTTVDSRSSSADVVRLGATVASGATSLRPYYLSSNNNAAGYVGVSAEL
jgi:hypothetical protein